MRAAAMSTHAPPSQYSAHGNCVNTIRVGCLSIGGPAHANLRLMAEVTLYNDRDTVKTKERVTEELERWIVYAH